MSCPRGEQAEMLTVVMCMSIYAPHISCVTPWVIPWLFNFIFEMFYTVSSNVCFQLWSFTLDYIFMMTSCPMPWKMSGTQIMFSCYHPSWQQSQPSVIISELSTTSVPSKYSNLFSPWNQKVFLNVLDFTLRKWSQSKCGITIALFRSSRTSVMRKESAEGWQHSVCACEYSLEWKSKVNND